MTNKTEGVKELVQEIMRTFSEPYDEDLTLKVCLAIEGHPDWKKRYDDLGQELRPWVVNNWIGQYTKALSGMKTVREVDLKDKHIITAYTKLS